MYSVCVRARYRSRQEKWSSFDSQPGILRTPYLLFGCLISLARSTRQGEPSKVSDVVLDTSVFCFAEGRWPFQRQIRTELDDTYIHNIEEVDDGPKCAGPGFFAGLQCLPRSTLSPSLPTSVSSGYHLTNTVAVWTGSAHPHADGRNSNWVRSRHRTVPRSLSSRSTLSQRLGMIPRSLRYYSLRAG